MPDRSICLTGCWCDRWELIRDIGTEFDPGQPFDGATRDHLLLHCRPPTEERLTRPRTTNCTGYPTDLLLICLSQSPNLPSMEQSSNDPGPGQERWCCWAFCLAVDIVAYANWLRKNGHMKLLLMFLLSTNIVSCHFCTLQWKWMFSCFSEKKKEYWD